jgi:hypothetical protein
MGMPPMGMPQMGVLPPQMGQKPNIPPKQPWDWLMMMKHLSFKINFDTMKK